MFTFADFFAGIGGFRITFEQAGGKCALSCEIDKFARQTYRANFGAEPEYGDIREIDAAALPQFDVLLAGFPCQPFTTMGRRTGVADPRNGYAFGELLRILAHCRPKALCLENVRGLMNMAKGQTFADMMASLDRLGYNVQWRLLNARAWLPQNRIRIYMVGFLGWTGFRIHDDVDVPAQGPTLSTVLLPDDEIPDSYAVSEVGWRQIHRRAKRKHRTSGRIQVFGPDDATTTLLCKHHYDCADIHIRRPGHERPRRLTAREMARLQGFGDGFEIPVSLTQARKQFGNAVAVPCAAAVAKAMQPHLGRPE